MSDLENSVNETPEVEQEVESSISAPEETVALTDLEKAFLDAKQEKEKLTNPVKETPKAEEYSDIEKEAMSMGWRPANKFDTSSEGKRFISAEEFIERGNLFKKIDHQKAELQQLKTTMKDMADHFKKSEEIAYNRALNELLGLRNKAVEEGNVEDFRRIDTQVAEVQRQAYEALNVPSPQIEAPQAKPISPEVETFYERNKHWFNNNTQENSRMVNFALAADELMAIRRPDLTEKDRIELVEADLRHAFPHRFENSNRNAPPTVATRTLETTTSTKSSNLVQKLTHRQKALAKEMVENKIYSSVEEYAKDLASRGVI